MTQRRLLLNEQPNISSAACTTQAINLALSNTLPEDPENIEPLSDVLSVLTKELKKQRRQSNKNIPQSITLRVGQEKMNELLDPTFEEDFFIMETDFLLDLSEATETVDRVTNTFSELVDYPVSMSVSTIDNLAAMLLTIPQMVSVSNDTNNTLNDVGNSLSMPNQASLGVSVGFTYLDAIINIISGTSLIMDEEDCHLTRNKTKGVAQIISGALALAVAYNPVLEGAIGLGAGALAGPAYAFMTLVDLINSSIDFYGASKKTSIEGWLDDQVDEINHVDKRIEKLKEERMELGSKHFKNDEKRQHLVEKIDKKLIELTKKRNTLINDFNLRSKIYCYGENEKSLKVLDKGEYQRREKYLHSKIKNITNKESALSADFRKAPTKIIDGNKVYINTSMKPTMQETLRNNAIQSQLIEDYKEKRTNLILKTLSFIGATLFALAPIAGPAAPLFYASGLVITLCVTGYYIYKHREKIKEAGNLVINKMKDVFFQEKKKEFEMDTFPLEDPSKRLCLT